ncbi:hypothetical protein METHPM2_40104 [Pseudomonas sp. PM2]
MPSCGIENRTLNFRKSRSATPKPSTCGAEAVEERRVGVYPLKLRDTYGFQAYLLDASVVSEHDAHGTEIRSWMAHFPRRDL